MRKEMNEDVVFISVSSSSEDESDEILVEKDKTTSSKSGSNSAELPCPPVCRTHVIEALHKQKQSITVSVSPLTQELNEKEEHLGSNQYVSEAPCEKFNKNMLTNSPSMKIKRKRTSSPADDSSDKQGKIKKPKIEELSVKKKPKLSDDKESKRKESNRKCSQSESKASKKQSRSKAKRLIPEPSPRALGDFTLGQQIEVFYRITSGNLVHHVWWPGNIQRLSKASSSHKTWIVHFQPMPPEFPKPSFSKVRYVNDHQLSDLGERKLLYWRDHNSNMQATPNDRIAHYIQAPKLVKYTRSQRSSDRDDSDESNESELEDSFIAKEDDVDVFRPPRELPDEAFTPHIKDPNPPKTIVHGLFCSKCKERQPYDSFSSKQRKVISDDIRYCLIHSLAGKGVGTKVIHKTLSIS